MKERCLQAICGILILLGPPLLRGQQPLTWQEVQDKFHAANRSLQAGQIGVDESRASETTAYLRPNPTLNVLNDQINPFNGGPPHSTFGFLLSTAFLRTRRRRNRCAWRRSNAQLTSPAFWKSSSASLEEEAHVVPNRRRGPHDSRKDAKIHGGAN